jgi:hypothetical protein
MSTSTLTVELPDQLAVELAENQVNVKDLNAFVVGAVEAWLRRRKASLSETSSWSDTFRQSAVSFVDELIEDNRDLFEELARR